MAVDDDDDVTKQKCDEVFDLQVKRTLGELTLLFHNDDDQFMEVKCHKSPTAKKE